MATRRSGSHGAPATVQSDLYGLGLILYETYTGKPALNADSMLEWERAHSDSTPTNPSELATDVEPAVERAILRCLEKDPTKRPAAAAQGDCPSTIREPPAQSHGIHRVRSES
jgi:serine/threonine-protein kinase